MTFARGSLGYLTAVGFSLTLGSIGCSAAKDGEPVDPNGFDSTVRGRVRTALRVVAKCGQRGGGGLDPACVAAARNDANAMAVDAAADKVSHAAICRALRTASGDANTYYVQGASVPAAENRGGRADIARVWDLGRGQFAAFASADKGLGAAASNASEAYAGFATSTGDRDVVAAWTNRSFAAGGGYDSPLRTSGTSDAYVTDDRNELRVQVGFAPAGQSLSAFALGPAATTIAHGALGSTNAAVAMLTQSMHVLDGSEEIVSTANGSFVTIRAGAGLDAGTALAVHVLQLSGGQTGSFSAALAAVVRDTAGGTEVLRRCAGDDLVSASAQPRAQGLHPQNSLIETTSELLNFDFDPFWTKLVHPSPNPAEDHLGTEIVLAAFIGCQSLGWSDWTTGCFTGDSRGYDYGSAMSGSRLAGRATLQGNGAPSTQAYVGETHMLACSDTTGSDTCTSIKEGAKYQQTKRAAISSVGIAPVGLSPYQDKVRFVFSGKNPLVALAPAIDGTIDVFVDYEVVDGRRTRVTGYSTTGSHDGFPSWELYINGLRVHEYDPIPHGCTPLALAGGCSQPVGGSFGP